MIINFDFLDSEEFYNLMQDYRNAPIHAQCFAFDAFCEVKKYIKSEIWKQTIEEERFRADCETDIS